MVKGGNPGGVNPAFQADDGSLYEFIYHYYRYLCGEDDKLTEDALNLIQEIDYYGTKEEQEELWRAMQIAEREYDMERKKRLEALQKEQYKKNLPAHYGSW